jgi:predicted DNA-binding ribbon-helix-helix protein
MLVNTAQSFMPPAPSYALLWSARHLKAPHRTTVRLENYFWQQIEVVAKNCGMSWRHWAENTLSEKPSGANSASWLRVNCLCNVLAVSQVEYIPQAKPKA